MYDIIPYAHLGACICEDVVLCLDFTGPNESLEYLGLWEWQVAAICVDVCDVQSQGCADLMCVWSKAVEFRRVGVWSAVAKRGFPPSGYGQTGLLRNHCDCCWTLATLKEKQKKSSCCAWTNHSFLKVPCRLHGKKNEITQTVLHLNEMLLPNSIWGPMCHM